LKKRENLKSHFHSHQERC